MDEPQTTEFLSAYFDDELSLDVRAEVEHRLNHSPELRTELDEIAGLSNLLNTLPRRSAPPDLAPSILRQIERDFSLRRPIIRPMPVAARAWTAVVSSLFVTAAALFAMLPLLRQTPQAGHSVGEGIVAESAPADGGSAISLNHSLADADRNGNEVLGLQADGMATETATARQNGRDMSLGAAQNRLASSEAEMKRDSANAARMRDTNGIEAIAAVPALPPDTTQSPPEIVDGTAELQHISQVRDEVAVVEIYCDDVASGMTKLREVLVNNSIQPLLERGASGGNSRDRTDAKQPEMPEAVYVEASRRQLDSAFTELRQQQDLAAIVQIETMNWNEILVERIDGDSTTGRVLDDKPVHQESLAENVKRLRHFAEHSDTGSGWGAVKTWQSGNDLLLKPDLNTTRGLGQSLPSAPAVTPPNEEDRSRASVAAPLANQSRHMKSIEKQEAAIATEPMQRKAMVPHSAAIAEKPVDVTSEVFFQHAFQLPVQLPRSAATHRGRERALQAKPSPSYAEGDAAGQAIARRQREVAEKEKAADKAAEASVRVMFVLQRTSAASGETGDHVPNE